MYCILTTMYFKNYLDLILQLLMFKINKFSHTNKLIIYFNKLNFGGLCEHEFNDTNAIF